MGSKQTISIAISQQWDMILSPVALRPSLPSTGDDGCCQVALAAAPRRFWGSSQPDKSKHFIWDSSVAMNANPGRKSRTFAPFPSFPILSLCPRPNLLGPQACLFHWANPGSIPWRWPSGFWKVVFEDLRSQNMGLSENWVYSQWNSHLIGIMIINHWV